MSLGVSRFPQRYTSPLKGKSSSVTVSSVWCYVCILALSSVGFFPAVFPIESVLFFSAGFFPGEGWPPSPKLCLYVWPPALIMLSVSIVVNDDNCGIHSRL